MNKPLSVAPRSLLLFACITLTLAAPGPPAAAQDADRPMSTDMPHLLKQGTATQLIVDGKPFLALAGELNNDSATQPRVHEAGVAEACPGKAQHRAGGRFLGQIEPQEGKFDFACWTA